MLEVKFWGVRGSVAAPGPATSEVGGNTSCVEVRAGATTLVLDAGTGLRNLGDALLQQGRSNVHLLLSHLHWDHIQGLPFFVPAYLPGTHLDVYGPTDLAELAATLAAQMRPPTFPVRFEDLRSSIALHRAVPGRATILGEARVLAEPLNHPGGVLGYRIEHGGRSVVYATDTEHEPESDARLIELARGADLLIYDSMYTPEEYRGETGPPKTGWGHSTFRDGARIAREAGVGTLVLFHHDPSRSDADVRALLQRAREEFEHVVAAREGLGFDLSSRADAA